MSTIRDVVSRSLKLIEELADGQSASGAQAEDGLKSLITMVDSWSIQNKLVFTETRESFTLVSGTGTYTIGSGATFDTVRPTEITSCFVRDGVNDFGLDPISADEYAVITDKSTTGTPRKIYYDANYPNGSIILWPVPDKAYDLHIYSKKPLSNFSSLSDTLSAPAGYERAFIYNLAIELSPEYGKTPSPVVIKIAGESKKAIESANSLNDNTVLYADAGLLRNNTWDVYNDEV